MWRALKAISDDDAALGGLDLDDLIERGEAQRRALEAERLEVGTRVLRAGEGA